MRICHVVKSVDPVWGGPTTVVLGLSRAQARRGHEIIVHAERPPADRLSEVEAAIAPAREAGVQFRFHQPFGALSYALGTLDGLDRAHHVHLHGVWDAILQRAARTARKSGTSHAVCAHGMLDPWCLGQSRAKKKIALALGVRRMLDRTRFLHVLNADEARLLAPLGLRCPPRVIPNGINPEELAPEVRRGAFRAAHGLGEAPLILFLARLHMKKGLDILVRAFALARASLPHAHLVVAGPDEGAGDEAREIAASLGVQAQTHFVGPLYGRAKAEALADADCFALSSRTEGFSVALLEAMAYGLPVVISTECHFPEVEGAGCGIETTLEPTDVARALVATLSDPGARARMGKAGRELVMRQYTWEAVAARVDATLLEFGVS